MKFVIFCAFFDITTMQQSHLFFQHFLPSFIYDLLYFQVQDAADDGVVMLPARLKQIQHGLFLYLFLWSH